MPSLIIANNPFDLNDRTVSAVPTRRRIKALCPKSEFPVICMYNGRPLLRAGWNRRVRRTDIVVFVATPRNNGPNRGFWQFLGTIVVAYAAGVAGNYVSGASGLGMGAGWGAAASAAVSIGGSMLLSAALPPPGLPSAQAAAEMSAPSPTYNIAAQGNLARLEQPIPVQYGRHIAFPDFAATPYVEYHDNQQGLYQLLVIGQGHHDIEEIRIEDTAIENFDGVTTEVILPGGSVTLFPSAVIQSGEVAGAELGNLGPYSASGADQFANAIGVDLIFPGGLYYANDNGGLSSLSVTVRFEAREIDDEGDPVGSFFTLGTETVSGATNTAIRKSYRYAVTAARYEVKAVRTDTKSTSSRAAHTVLWAGLRAYLPNEQDFGDVTLLAVRMAASSQLSSASARKINVISTRMLPIYDVETGWSDPVATRSIAWALADVCRATYGANLADDRYDLSALIALDAVWQARGDYFDARFDSKQTVWESLTHVARAGRAKPYQQAGMIRFWRDSAQTVPTAIFTPRNMLPGTFSMAYAPAVTETADAVRMTYFDARFWRQRDALCYTAGSSGETPAEIQAFGMVDREHVVREGMYIAASNRYRRRPVSFQTEAEGLLPRFGDLIGISHDMPAWGQSGDVTEWEVVDALTAALSEPPVWTPATTHYIRLIKADGTSTGNIAVTAGVTDNEVVLASDPGFVPETDGATRERTRYVFGVAGNLYTEAIVTRILPKSGLNVEILAVIEDARVHTADGSTLPDAVTDPLETVPSAPVVTGLNVTEGGTPDAPVQYVAWQRASGADTYWVESTTDGTHWQRQANTTATEAVISGIPSGQTLNIRVAGVGMLRGAWVTWTGTSGEDVSEPGDISGLALETAFTGPVLLVKWAPAARATSYRVEVWADSIKQRENIIVTTRYAYSAADAQADGGQWRDLEVRVTGLGVGAGQTAALSVSNPQVGQLDNVQVVSNATGALWSCLPPDDPDLAGFRVYASQTHGFTPGSGNLIYDGASAIRQLPLEPNKTWYVRAGAYDRWGADDIELTGEFTVVTGAIGADHISVASLSAIVANLGEIVAGRMHSADNTVDFDLDNKRLTVADAMGNERVKLGMLSTGSYGLRVKSADGTRQTVLSPEIGTVIASGQVTLTTSLNSDGTYGYGVDLGREFDFADISVMISEAETPAARTGFVWVEPITGWGYGFDPIYRSTMFTHVLLSDVVLKERDGDTSAGRAKYKAHTIPSFSADAHCVLDVSNLLRWDRGSATSGDTVWIAGAKAIRVVDKAASVVKNCIDITYPTTVSYTIIARNFEG